MMMDATLFKSILDIKTVKAFGKKYDATVGIQYFKSSNPQRQSLDYMALTLSNIKPANMMVKLKDILKSPTKTIALRTYATNNSKFVESLSRKNKNTLLDLYEKVSK